MHHSGIPTFLAILFHCVSPIFLYKYLTADAFFLVKDVFCATCIFNPEYTSFKYFTPLKTVTYDTVEDSSIPFSSLYFYFGGIHKGTRPFIWACFSSLLVNQRIAECILRIHNIQVTHTSAIVSNLLKQENVLP